jgi:E3 ubiquitin-protein ligase SIAH1
VQATHCLLEEDHYLPDVWNILECPVCLQIVAAPVFQCGGGHHMCNNCSQRIRSCPLCKRGLSATRNYAVEAIVEKIPLPCRYRVEGCNEMMCQRDKASHENSCQFRLYPCFVCGCNETHNLRGIRLHLKTSHSHLIYETDFCIQKG